MSLPGFLCKYAHTPSINKNNLLPQSLSFVSEELFEFVERPCVQFSVELCTSPIRTRIFERSSSAKTVYSEFTICFEIQ